MSFLIGIVAFLLSAASIASAQPISFTSSRYETVAQNATIYDRETARIERFLTNRFPTSNLRWAARAKGQPILRKVTYEQVTHAGVRYLVAVFTSRYNEPVNVLAVYQLSGEKAGERVWRSKTWTSNYYGNSIATYKSGSRTIVLFKEGAIMPGDFGLASIFSISRWGGRSYVRDMTPKNSPLAVKTSFPFRALLGQNIRLDLASQGSLTLAASESMYRYEDQIFQQTHEWHYDRKKNSFEPVILSAAKVADGN
jgi:hypothetical protein